MMNGPRLRAIVGKIGYKPDTWFRVTHKESESGPVLFLQHCQMLADCKDPSQGISEQRGRKFYISEHMTESEVIQTCLMAILAFEEHEAREWFTYKGLEVYGPHIDITQRDART